MNIKNSISKKILTYNHFTQYCQSSIFKVSILFFNTCTPTTANPKSCLKNTNIMPIGSLKLMQKLKNRRLIQNEISTHSMSIEICLM